MARIMKDSGIDWLGMIPNDWEVRKVKNYYKMQTGFTPDTKNPDFYDDEYGYDWVTIGDLNGGKYIPETTKGKISKKYVDEYTPEIIPKGSLLYSFKLSVGQVAFADRDVYSNEAIASFIKDENINLNFLFYSSCMIVENANENIYGAKILNQELIRNASIVFPPLEEQQKIADFLDDKVGEIDVIISKTKASIEEYKKYKNAVIAETITKGLDKTVSMKESGIEWVGKIPSHWEIHTLSQVFMQLKNKNSDLSETNLLSLSYGKIKRKDINSSDGLLPESFDGYNIIDKNDIVLRLTDLQNDHKSLRVGHVKERGIITSAYVTLRCKEDIATDYYYYFLHTFDIFKGFYGMGAGVRQGLNYEGIRSMKILSPDIKEQQEIVEYLNVKCAEIDALIAKKEAFVEEMEAYKKSLIYEYVTGKKEVL